MDRSDSNPRCPICGGHAEFGRLYGHGNSRLKWLRWDRPLFLGAWALGSTPVGESGWHYPSGRARVDGVACQSCGKIVIDAGIIVTERRLLFGVRVPFLSLTTLAGLLAGFDASVRMPHAVCTLLWCLSVGLVGYYIGLALILVIDRLLDRRAEKKRLATAHERRADSASQ